MPIVVSVRVPRSDPMFNLLLKLHAFVELTFSEAFNDNLLEEYKWAREVRFTF